MTNDLTVEENVTLGNLSDPDKISSGGYAWDEEVQREILGLILNDHYFIVQSNGLIDPRYFTNEAHRIVSKIVFKHFEKYRCLPAKTQIIQELKDLTENKDPKFVSHYLSEVNVVYEYYVPGLESREYYLDKISNFAKTMAIRNAFSESLKEISERPASDETWVKVELTLRKALSVDRNIDIGLDYFQTVEDRYERRLKEKEAGEMIATGFPKIDEALSCGGLTKGEIGSIMALPGVGKTIFLVNVAVHNLHRDKKVLFISLEMDQDKCAERFDILLANPQPFGDSSNGINLRNLYEKKDKVFDAIKSYVTEKDDQRLLVVKQFPAGEMDLAAFRAYYTQLSLFNFHPNLVIIDYVGEMRDYPGMPTWESRQKVVRDLKGYGQQEGFTVLTAMQPDGKSREITQLEGVIDDGNLAESKGQNRPLDALWSLNQFQDEKECGLARLWVAKHRDGKSRFTVHVEFDYNTLKLRQISENRYNTILTKHRNEKDKTVSQAVKDSKINEIDKIVKPNFVDKGIQEIEEVPDEVKKELDVH